MPPSSPLKRVDQQQPEAELPQEVRSEVASEREARQAPETVDSDYLRHVVESAVQQAESRRKSIQEAKSFIAQRVELYGDKLTDAESAKLQEILADADRRLREIQDAGTQAMEAKLSVVPDAGAPAVEAKQDSEMEISFEMPKVRQASAPEDLPVAEPAAKTTEAPPDLDFDIDEDAEVVKPPEEAKQQLAKEGSSTEKENAILAGVEQTLRRARTEDWSTERLQQTLESLLSTVQGALSRQKYDLLREVVDDELARSRREEIALAPLDAIVDAEEDNGETVEDPSISQGLRAYVQHPEQKMERWLPKQKAVPTGSEEVEAEIVGDPIPSRRTVRAPREGVRVPDAILAPESKRQVSAGEQPRGLLGDGPAIPAERVYPDAVDGLAPGELPVRGYLESGKTTYVPEMIAGVPAFVEPPTVRDIPGSIAEGARPEAKPGRKYSPRELLNLGKIRDRYAEDLEGLADAMMQAKYAEANGILETERVRGTLKVLVEAMGAGAKLEDQQAQLNALAVELGIDPKQVRELYLQQFRHVDDLARQQVEQKGKKGKLALLALGLGKVGAYAAAGAGLMALAGPFGMAGIPALRAAENALLDRRKRGKVEEAAVAIRAELSTGTGDYSAAFLEKFARDLAIAKQQQIDQVDDRAMGVRQNEVALNAYRDAAKQEKGAARGSTEYANLVGVSEALRLRYIAEATRHLTEQHPDLSEEARGEMGRLAGAVFTMDQSNAILEAEQSGRAKSFFSRGVQFIEKTLGSKWLRGGEKPSEKTVTALIYGSLGFLARSTPGVARVMYGYAGMKAAELAARRGMAMVGGERYAGLRHGTADEFRSAIDSGAGDPKLLARIHQQLLDPEFRNSASLSEQAAVQDAARRLENQIARGGLDAVSQHSDALEDAVVTREKRDRERKAIIGGARIAGLILGATLGPVIIEAIRPQPHLETDPLQKHNPHFENTRFVARADADLFRMAQIKEGDGLTQVLQRQLEHAPDVYGFKGAPEDVHRWALAEAKRIATENGYLTADGRTTATGLRFFGEGNSGGVLLHPSGQLEKIGPVEDYDTWLEHAKGRTPGGGLDALDREFQELSVEQTKQAVEKGITEVDAEVGKIMERIGGRHAGEAISPLSAEERSLYALQLKALFGKMHILEKELGGVAGPQTGGNLDQQKLYAHLEGTRGDLAQLQDELALEHGVSLDAPDAEAVALGDPSVRGGGGNPVTESGAGSVEPRGPSAPTSGDRPPAGWADDMRGTGAGEGLRGSSDPFAAAEAEASGGNAAWKGLVGAVEKGTGGVLRGSDMAGVFRLGETGARVSMHALEQLRSASLKDVLTSTDGSLGDMKQELLNRLAAAHPDWKVPGGAVTTDSLLKGLGGDANVKALDYLKNHHELLGRSPEA